MANTTDIYYFQNPSTGYPMLLTNTLFRDGRLCVECCDDDDGKAPWAKDEYDAERMTEAVRAHCGTDLYEAAKYLYSVFHCKDILS